MPNRVNLSPVFMLILSSSLVRSCALLHVCVCVFCMDECIALLLDCSFVHRKYCSRGRPLTLTLSLPSWWLR